MIRQRTFLLSLLASTVIALASTGCGSDDDDTPDLDSELTIENESSFTMIGIYLSPTSSVQWGEDLLGRDVLEPGDSLEISGIECGVYDIRIVDEDDDECILESVDLCLDQATWSIDDDELIDCQF